MQSVQAPPVQQIDFGNASKLGPLPTEVISQEKGQLREKGIEFYGRLLQSLNSNLNHPAVSSARQVLVSESMRIEPRHPGMSQNDRRSRFRDTMNFCQRCYQQGDSLGDHYVDALVW